MKQRAILELRITKLFYQDKILLQDLHLDVGSAEKILIVGSTGSGKTSLLHTLNLMNPHYEGSILFKGKDIRQYKAEALRLGIMEVMQEPWLEDMPVLDVLKEPWSYAVHKDRKQVFGDAWLQGIEKLLQSFGLSPEILKSRSSKLSGGEKQRIALIRTLQFDPEVLLLDEISSALDQKTSGLISDCLFQNYSGCIIAISHDPLWQSKWTKVWKLEAGSLMVSTLSSGGE